ncbi:MAG: nitrogen regulation protein NR(II) [Halieaceae bacterium]|jgi:two-component system nitrogen regulation sensor histidine kinase GlnL|nr:nitrogen regulation protein NR(II) [Halieaceae bacterium]
MMDSSFHAHILDNLTTAVLVLNPDLTLRFLSPAAEAMLELSQARSVGSRLDELLPDQLEFIARQHREAPPDGPYTNRGVNLSTSSGHTLVVDCTVSPLVGEGRNVLGLVIEIHPVDRIRRISREDNLLTSHETTQALIRGLAHEIKNPLGGLRGAAQLLERELPEPGLEEYTRIIIEESDRLRALVDRMLGPHKQPRLASLNVHEVLEHVRTLQQAETGESVQFVRDYDPSLPNLLGDRSQLIQAILNIVRNGVQATASNEGPRVMTLQTRVHRQFTIGAKRHRLVCGIRISDNGPGIPEELRESLFFPMVSGRPEGSGLGLAISQAVVARHKGLIECDSEPGQTDFNIYLPLEHEHAST